MIQEKQEPKVTYQNHYKSYVENMKKYTDEKRNVKVHNFKIGDIVYVANVEPGKLDSSYNVTKYVIIWKKSEDTFEIVNTVTGIKFVRNVKFLRKAPLDKPVVFEHSEPVRNDVRCEGQDKMQVESDQKDTTCVEEMDNSQVEQKVTRSGRMVNPPN